LEYIKYYIKRGDTLEFIAKELGIGKEFLKEYHNKYCDLNSLIGGDKLPKSGYILIPDTIENLKERHEGIIENNNIDLKQEPIELVNYSILQTIDMQVSGQSMLDSETEILWEYEKRKGENFFYDKISQKKNILKYIKSIYRPLAEYMQKFNIPLELLFLKIYPQGGIAEVQNQESIYEQWLEVKKELIPEMGNTLEEQQILEGGDKDFSNSLTLLNKNLIFRLFFMKLYKPYLVSDSFVLIESLPFTSQIFEQEEVKLITKQKVEKNDYLLKIKFYSEEDPLKVSKLKELYNNKLKDFFKQDFNYSFSWSIEYTFDLRNNQMLFCHSKIREQACSHYKYLTEHKISLMKKNTYSE